jgi:hypothetical protein
MFSIEESIFEESVGFGGSESFVFGALVFILEIVGKSIIQDGYKLSKQKILSYLKKDEQKISDKVSPDDLILTTDTIKKLILLLQDELNKNKEEIKENTK